MTRQDREQSQEVRGRPSLSDFLASIESTRPWPNLADIGVDPAKALQRVQVMAFLLHLMAGALITCAVLGIACLMEFVGARIGVEGDLRRLFTASYSILSTIAAAVFLVFVIRLSWSLLRIRGSRTHRTSSVVVRRRP